MRPSPPPELPVHASRGVRALVLLHDEQLRAFVEVWRRARAAGLRLPPSADPNYASLDVLLAHVCRAARGYMTWICEQLGFPDPGLLPVPAAEQLPAALDGWLEALLAGWLRPLAGVRDEQLDQPEYRSRWGTHYSVDAMLEHAVMHPLRHAFQLRELLVAAGQL